MAEPLPVPLIFSGSKQGQVFNVTVGYGIGDIRVDEIHPSAGATGFADHISPLSLTVKVSLPAPPVSVLLPTPAMRKSLPEPPVAFRMSEIELKPDAVPVARSTVTLLAADVPA